MTKLNGTTEIDENLLLSSSNFLKQREYWEKKLSGEITGTYLLSEVKSKTPTRQTNGKIDIIFPAAVCNRLLNLSKNSDISISIILLAALKILIYRYGNNDNEDIIILSPVYTDNVSEETINDWVMIRDQVKPALIVKEFILKIRQSVLEAYENQDYPLEKLIDDLLPLFAGSFIDGNRRFITNVVSIFKNIHAHYPGEQETGDRLIFIFERTKADKLQGHIRYNAGIYDDHYTRQAAGHFLKILEQIIFQTETRITGISLLSKQEQKQLLEDFNRETTVYSPGKTIHELFTRQAGKAPGRTALVGKNEGWKGGRIEGKKEEMHLTYRELDEKSNRLAWLLKAKGVQTGTIAGIMLKRSIEMVLGIFAILKAGAAYLPIEMDTPWERVKYILADSSVGVLLGKAGEAGKVKKLNRGIEMIDPDQIESHGDFSTPIARQAQPGQLNLAYVMYTSGSTGQPKGVLVEHPAVVNIILVLNKKYPFTLGDAFLLKTSYLFDVSVTELFGFFAGGGRLVVLDKDGEKDPLFILEQVQRAGITHINFVPSMFNLFAGILNRQNIKKLSGIKYIFLAGEALQPAGIKKFIQLAPAVRLENLYGPTEGTVYATGYSLRHWNGSGPIPIGKPLSNVKIYILDRSGTPQPVGITGELFIGGVGIAKGYLNNPVMTNSKFQILNSKQIPNYNVQNYKQNGIYASMQYHSPSPHYPITPLPHSPIYCTGDLGFWHPDGNIGFIGRKDFQVKIRGHRIELGEIENRLLAIDFIKEAVVIDRELPGKDQEDTPDRYLCAYVVAHENAPVSQLPDILSQHLPHYMIPSYFTKIDRIPLTATGKVDRELLPEPGVTADTNYIAPRTAVEKKMVVIWSGILARDANQASQMRSLIGIHDNFFRLGGHSLKAAVLMSTIHKMFNVKITLGEIFSHPTLSGLARFIGGLKENKYRLITPQEKKEYYILSSAQKRLYIQQQMKPDNIIYNLPMYINLAGKLDRERLETVFRHLVRRHESLRTSFDVVEDEAVQRIHDEVEFRIEYYDKQEAEVEVKAEDSDTGGTRGLAPLPAELAARSPQPVTDIISSFIRPFDFSRAPLLRVRLIKLENQKHILMIDMHHIVTDGTSLAILSREFMGLYTGKKLPALEIQYKDFSAWQNRLFETGEIKNQETYWLKQFQGDIPLLDLPTNFPGTEAGNSQGEYFLSKIPGEMAAAVKQLELETETTLHMVLLAVSTILFSKYSGREDIVVGTGIAGRQHPDLENVIGLFINMLAMRNQPKENKTFIQFLEAVKENALDAYANQDYQFETLVQQLGLQGNLSRNPLFDVVFQTQNLENPTIEVQDLTFKPYEKDFQVSRFDLVIYCEEEAQNESINLRYLYSPALFTRATIEKMTNHFVEILTQVLGNRQIKLKDIKISMEVSAARTKLQQEKLNFQF